MSDSLSIKENKRNSSLDILKLFASFFVVFIHVNFYGEFGSVVKAFASFAVPVFFITSGYYSYSAVNNKDIKKLCLRIISLLKILIVAIVLYSGVYILINGIGDYAAFFLQKKTYIKFFLLNNFENTFFTPLWFLPALIYSYIVIILITKLKLQRFIPYLTVLFIPLFVITFLETRYTLSEAFYRNFLFMGLPYFSAGYILKMKADKVKEFSSFKVLSLIIISVILFVILYFTIGYVNPAVIVFSVSLFVLSLINVKTVDNAFVGFFIQKASMYIYIVHWVIWNLMCYFKLTVNSWLNPLITLGVSLLISLIISALSFAVNNKRRSQV